LTEAIFVLILRKIKSKVKLMKSINKTMIEHAVKIAHEIKANAFLCVC